MNNIEQVNGLHVSLYHEAKNNFQQAQVELAEAIKQLDAAVKLGDLSENAEYDAAKESVRQLQTRVDMLGPVMQMAPVQARDSVEVIEPGCLVHLTIYDVMREYRDPTTQVFSQKLSQPPQFEGVLIYGYGLPVHELLKDKVLSTNTPIGMAINGVESGHYCVKVPAGFAVVHVEKVKFADHKDEEGFWLKYDGPEMRNSGGV